MNRRTFNLLAGFGVLGTLGNAQAQPMTKLDEQPHKLGPEVVIEDEHVLIGFDQLSGAITRLVKKNTGWTIQNRPELGLSFRMLAPLPKQRTNFIFGNMQRARKVVRTSDSQIQIEWNNLQSQHGGVLPIRFLATITLVAGELTFQAEVQNNSKLTIETIEYPYIGDLATPSPGETMSSEHMWYGNLPDSQLHPHFNNEKGYWGVDFPTQTVESKQSLFCAIQAATQGLYMEIADPTQPYLLEFTFEQHPGIEDSVLGIVPPGSEISGLPIHLECRLCHFLFVKPGASRKFAPIVFRTYDGDWHQAVAVYKQRRETWYKQPHIAAWVKNVHSWMQLQIDGAEQDYSIPYRDIPQYIDECAANGVTAIQLVGWNKGGQDGGDPSQDTDPGLGTWEDLKDAVDYANKKGVKMILFGKLYWADLTTQLYKDLLYKYAATDPYGIKYETGGYSYTTPTQLAGINNRRRAIMDVQDPAYRDFATQEFKKILKFGAAGWLFDEVCHHGPVEYSFSPTHGYPAPGYIYGGDMPFAHELREAADAVNPDFIFSGEGPQDWLMQYYPVSYFRIGAGSRPVCRLIDSQAPLVVAVTGFNDREKLNLILLERYIISYEPYNFKGHLTDFPLTLAYGQKIDALRQRYKVQLWDAEFQDTMGASVKSNPPCRHSVFVQENGKRAVVVVNQDAKHAVKATLQLPNAGRLVTVTPEHPDQKHSSGEAEIPARSAVIFLEI